VVFNNIKWISLLPDISMLATLLQWGRWSAACQTNMTGLRQQVEKESSLWCCWSEFHLQAGKCRLQSENPCWLKRHCNKSLNETLILQTMCKT
jgi:hypothetical protein